MTDTKLLRDIIKTSGLKYAHLARALGLSPFGLQKKIDNDTEFKAGEIKKLCDILRLSLEEKENVFFAK